MPHSCTRCHRATPGCPSPHHTQPCSSRCVRPGLPERSEQGVRHLLPQLACGEGRGRANAICGAAAVIRALWPASGSVLHRCIPCWQDGCKGTEMEHRVRATSRDTPVGASCLQVRMFAQQTESLCSCVVQTQGCSRATSLHPSCCRRTVAASCKPRECCSCTPTPRQQRPWPTDTGSILDGLESHRRKVCKAAAWLQVHQCVYLQIVS